MPVHLYAFRVGGRRIVASNKVNGVVGNKDGEAAVEVGGMFEGSRVWYRQEGVCLNVCS